jgi:hypothetical protein
MITLSKTTYRVRGMKLIRKIGLILAIVLIALAALPGNVCLAQGATISMYA